MKSSLQKYQNIGKNIYFALLLPWQWDRSYYLYIVIDVLLKAISPLLVVMFPRFIVDSLSASDFMLAFWYATFMSIALFISRVGMTFSSWIVELKGKEMHLGLNKQLGRKIMSIRYEVLKTEQTLNSYNLAKKSLENNSTEKFFRDTVIIISGIFTLLGLAYIISSLTTWIFITIAVVIGVNSIGQIKRLNFNYQQYQEETPVERNLYYARDYLTRPEFAKEIRLFNMYQFISSKMLYYIEEFFEIQHKTAYKHIKVLWWTHAVNGLQLFLVYLYLVYQYFQGQVTVGEFTMYAAGILLFSSILTNIIKAFLSIAKESKYTQELRYFLSIEAANYSDRTNVINLNQQNYEITFHNVFFSYPGQTNYALKNINISLKPNQTISIVGQNGAGKTTLIKLLLGLYLPTKGKIFLNQTDIRELNYREYLKLFSTVFQDYSILGYTVGENISMSNEVDLYKTKNILEQIGLAEKIKDLGQGLDTFMTRTFEVDGTEFSGGEHQKIAIARALYKDTPFLILDEPTAALSPQSEYELYQKLSEITKDKTAIFISHRLSSCRLADEIIVLEQGEIVGQGSHEHLLSKNQLYAKMFNTQAQYYSTKRGEQVVEEA